MSNPRVPFRITQRQLARAGLLAVQWLCLTVALGALVIHSAPSVEGIVSPSVDGAYVFIGAFVAAVLLGMTITSPKVALPLSLLMCLVSASFLAAIIFAPSWWGITVRTQALENFATTRVMFYLVLMFLPAMIGAFLGTAFGSMLSDRHNLLPDPERELTQIDRSWWERRERAN